VAQDVKMLIYLDNCTFNRPFDDQGQLRVRLEAEAKLGIQEGVLAGRYDLVWSYALDYENSANPFEERRTAIAKWRSRARTDVAESAEVLRSARELETMGIAGKDALHVACALGAGCEYFVTTDDLVLSRLKGYTGIRVVSPTEFIERVQP